MASVKRTRSRLENDQRSCSPSGSESGVNHPEYPPQPHSSISRGTTFTDSVLRRDSADAERPGKLTHTDAHEEEIEDGEHRNRHKTRCDFWLTTRCRALCYLNTLWYFLYLIINYGFVYCNWSGAVGWRLIILHSLGVATVAQIYRSSMPPTWMAVSPTRSSSLDSYIVPHGVRPNSTK